METTKTTFINNLKTSFLIQKQYIYTKDLKKALDVFYNHMKPYEKIKKILAENGSENIKIFSTYAKISDNSKLYFKDIDKVYMQEMHLIKLFLIVFKSGSMCYYVMR